MEETSTAARQHNVIDARHLFLARRERALANRSPNLNPEETEIKDCIQEVIEKLTVALMDMVAKR